MGIRARVFLLVFFSLAVSIRIAYVIAERDITSTFEEQTIFQLEKQAYLLLESVNEISKLDKPEANAIANRLGEASDSRVTLILNNGTVVGDSSLTKEQISILDNHINRKEIQEALINGKGWSSRYSSTLDQQLLYFAVTDQDVLNPNIIRIAVPYTYLDRVISSLNISIFLIGAVAFVVSFIASALIFNYTYRSLSELEDAISSLSVNPLKNNDIESAHSKDSLLANIMIYVVTKTFNTASWIYYGRREEGGRFFPKDFKKIQTPTGVAVFPAEMSEWPPRSYVERIFNIKQWTEMKSGGHFAAMEQPDLLINDIVKFSKSLR